MESMRPRGVIEYLEILWRKKLVIFLVAASMLVATFLIIRRLPNFYESRASIVISNKANDNQLLPETSFSALNQQMISYGNLMTIIRRYDLYRPEPGQVFNMDNTVERLRSEVKLDIKMRNYYPDGPESLTISYRYADPTIAQRVVADMVSIFEQANVTTRQQATTELERSRAKIEDIEAQLRSLAPQRDLAELRNQIARSPDTSPSSARSQRLAAANLIDSLSDKEFMLERQIDEQQRLIGEQEKLVRSAAAASGLQATGAYGVLLTRRAEVEGQIKDLAATVTEKNPKMIQARSQLAAINREIAQLEAARGANPDAAASSFSPEARELRVMQRELKRFQTELEVTRRDLNRKTQSLNTLPDLGAAPGASLSTGHLNESKAEYDRLLGRYNWLMDRQDGLQKLSGVDGSNTAMFQVIDAPRALRTPVAPNRRLLMLLGLGIALGLGLVVVAAREVPRLFLIHNDRDVEYYLGTPVLALIPETLTPFERSRRRRLWGLRWLGLTLFAAMMIPVFVMVLDRIQIFQILASR